MHKTLVTMMAMGLLACGTVEDEPEPYDCDPIDCQTAEAEALVVLDSYCARCHSAPGNAGAMDYILDPDELVARKKIIPGDSEGSPIYRRVSGNTMPPRGTEPRPEPYDVEVLRVWIDCLP